MDIQHFAINLEFILVFAQSKKRNIVFRNEGGGSKVVLSFFPENSSVLVSVSVYQCLKVVENIRCAKGISDAFINTVTLRSIHPYTYSNILEMHPTCQQRCILHTNLSLIHI